MQLRQILIKSVYDPYVNMLRTTTEAFSGVVGGVDSMEVQPFDSAIRLEMIFLAELLAILKLCCKTNAICCNR